MPKKVTWTDDMVGTLRRLRQLGNSQETCADRIGVCREQIMVKCQELGLAQRMNKGAVRGEEVLSRFTAGTRQRPTTVLK